MVIIYYYIGLFHYYVIITYYVINSHYYLLLTVKLNNDVIIQSVLLFLKTLNPFQVSKCLIYARSAALSCTGWVDRACCGPD